jgi:hypothetical protein
MLNREGEPIGLFRSIELIDGPLGKILGLASASNSSRKRRTPSFSSEKTSADDVVDGLMCRQIWDMSVSAYFLRRTRWKKHTSISVSPNSLSLPRVLWSCTQANNLGVNDPAANVKDSFLY